MITGRLSRLSDEARRVTEIAATVGRAFTVDVLRHACNADDQLLDVLDELWARRIICEVPGGYDFTHDLLREVAYEGISPARRRHLHAAVADALLAVHAADLGPVSAGLAMHYEQAGLVRQAVEALGRAAEHAYVVFAIDDAIAFLRPRWRCSTAFRTRVSATSSRWSSAPHSARRMWHAPGTAPRRCKSRTGEPCSSRDASADPRARRCSEASRSRPSVTPSSRWTTELGHELLAQSDDDPLALVEGHYVLGVSAFWRGELEAARENLERAIAEYRPERALEHLAHFAQDPRAVCSIRLAYTLWHLGHPAQGAQHGHNRAASLPRRSVIRRRSATS